MSNAEKYLQFSFFPLFKTDEPNRGRIKSQCKVGIHGYFVPFFFKQNSLLEGLQNRSLRVSCRRPAQHSWL